MTGRQLTLMTVHAHPDDEATGTGGILAKYAAEGVRTVLVTCTDGRAGDGPGGVKPGDPGHDPAEVVATRRDELAKSAEILGIDHVEQLGYADSGMMGWAGNEAPGSFWTTPVDEAAKRLGELIDTYRPDVIVTYDPNGFYGHPDHIQAHRVTMAAVAAAPAGAPAKVYWTTMPRTRIAEFVEAMREAGETWDEDDDEPPQDIGVPDDEVTTWIDATAYAGQKYDALAAHASQGDNIFLLRLGKDRFSHFLGHETLLRVRDSTGATIPEDDLFAGLR